MSRVRGVTLLALLVGAAGCTNDDARASASADSLMLAARAARFDRALAAPDSTAKDAPVARWLLPDHLQELSGFTVTANGKLFAHGDERGKVFQVDYRRGTIIKEFTLGSPPVHGDFESIAAVGDSLILFTSRGVLYGFHEGPDKGAVEYSQLDTDLGAACEFEGMAFEASSNSLLLACKHAHEKRWKDSLIIFRWPLGSDAEQRKGTRRPKDGKRDAGTVSHLAIPVASISGPQGWDGFEPSELTIDPFNGNLILISSKQQGLLELTPTGGIVQVRALPSGHAQPEAAAITREHLLLIGDEAHGGPARITLYRWPL
jgi:hypothetical protein